MAENGRGDRSTEMTGWNEDNFVERLLAQVRQQRGAESDPCPDAETLCAVLEGEAAGPLGEQVREHLRHCPDCAELQNRLLNFDTGTSSEPEAVWSETRKRLDNWLEGFLRLEAANLRPAKAAAPSHRGVLWETFWEPFVSWKLAWGLAALALLVFIAEGVLVMELRRARSPQVQVAARATVPQQQAANAERVASPPLAPLPSRGGESGPPLAPLPSRGGESGVGRALEVGPSSKQQALYAQKAGAPGGQVATPLPFSPPLNAAAPPAPAPPPSLRLEPGIHLLIALSSVEQLPAGTFQFRGTLSLPVPQAGPVSLDRGAEVIGAGTMSQAQTSLTVTELVVEGSRYTLKSGNGAMRAQTPGTGGLAQFDRGKLVEIWPESPSVYEKTPDTTPQP